MTTDPFRRLCRRRTDYRATFAGDSGRRVLADLYRFCHMDQPTFAADPFVTAFNEGQRRVFLRIAALLRLGDDEILKISTENHDD